MKKIWTCFDKIPLGVNPTVKNKLAMDLIKGPKYCKDYPDYFIKLNRFSYYLIKCLME